MAVRMRLRRIGKKKKPIYQIVVADSRSARTGKFLEVVGRYEPRQTPMLISTNEQRVTHWLNKGALPTETVRGLLRRTGFWFKWTLKRKGLDEATLATEIEKWQMQQAEKKKREDVQQPRQKAIHRKKKKGAEGGAAPAAPPAAEAAAQN